MKERDDLISATRAGLMMLRHASSVEDALHAPRGADGDYDPLAGAPAGRVWGGTREEAGYDPLR